MHYMTEEEPGYLERYTYYKLIVKEKLEFCFSNCVDSYFVDIPKNVLYILILE